MFAITQEHWNNSILSQVLKNKTINPFPTKPQTIKQYNTPDWAEYKAFFHVKIHLENKQKNNPETYV